MTQKTWATLQNKKSKQIGGYVILALVAFLVLFFVVRFQQSLKKTAYALTSVALRDAGDLDTDVGDTDDIESVLTGLSGETAMHNWSVNGADLQHVIMPFNAGAIQSDYSGNLNNGTKVGMTFNSTASALCRVGSCYTFNGTSDLMNYSIGTFNLSDATEGAVSAWVNTSANCGGTNGRCGIFELDYNASGDHRVQLALNTSDQVVFELFDGTTTHTLTSPAAINNGSWRNIIGSWNASGMNIFVDGVSVASNATAVDLGTFTTSSARTGAIFNTANTPNTDDFYSGILDDIQVFTKGLNADMAATIFADGNVGITGGPTQIDADLTTIGETWSLSITTHSTTTDLDVTTVATGNDITISAGGSGVGLNSGSTVLSTSFDLTSQVSNLTASQGGYDWSINGSSFHSLNLPFNEVGVQTDFSGSATNVVAIDSPTFTTSGCQVGVCYLFDGVNDQFDTNLTLANYISTQTGTISAWVRPTGVSPSVSFAYSGDQVIASSFYSGISQATISGQDRLWVFNYDGNEDRVGVAYTPNVWTHMVWVHSGGKLQLYKDGAFVGETESGDTQATNQEVRIGGTVAFGQPFQGYIDEVQTFQDALSPSQIVQMYTDGLANLAGPRVIHSEHTAGTEVWSLDVTPISSSGVIGSTATSDNSVTINTTPLSVSLNSGVTALDTYTNLESSVTGLLSSGGAYEWTKNSNPLLALSYPINSGSPQQDFSGNSRNGVVLGGHFSPSWQGECQVGGCMFFDGVNDQIDTNVILGTLVSEIEGSYSVWVKPTGTAPSVSFAYSGDQVIASSFYFGLSQANIGGQDRLWAYNYDANEDRIGTTYTLDTWTHLVSVRQGGRLTFYQDGALVGSVESGNTQAINQEVRIGGTVAIGQPFQGYIDEVQVYPFGLSAAQVSDLYDDGFASLPGPTELDDNEINTADVFNLVVTPIEEKGSVLSSTTSSNTVTISAPTVTTTLNLGGTTLSTFDNLSSVATGLNGIQAAYQWTENASPYMQYNVPFNSGSTIFDYSGNARNAVVTNFGTTGAAFSPSEQGRCQVGGCMFFDGVNDQVDTNFTLGTVISNNEGTMSLWVRPTGTAPSVSFAYSGDQAIASSFYSGLSQANIGGQDRLWAFNYDANEDRIGATYTPDVWTHLVWVHGGGQLLFYKDGALVGSTASGNTQATNQEVRIGGTVAFGQPFQGYIDEVQIWDFALSSSQIAQIYDDNNAGLSGPTVIRSQETVGSDEWQLSLTPLEENGEPLSLVNAGTTVTITVPPTSLNLNSGTTTLSTSQNLVPTISGVGDPQAALSWEENGAPYLSSNYPFNLGATQFDYSGNGFNATVTQAAFSPQGQGFCQVGGCLFFDGVNDRVDTNNVLSSFMTDTEGTFSVWVRPTGVAPSVSFAYNGDQIVASSFYSGISQANIGGEDRLWAFNYDTDEDRIGATYTPDVWTHLVWVHSGGQLRFYKDGSLVGSTPSGNTQATNQELHIGNTVAFGLPFQGYIDEVQTWDFGLTVSQIEQLYNDGTANIAGPSVITSSETIVADVWDLDITAFRGDGAPLSLTASTNTVSILAPSVTVQLNNGSAIIDPSQNLTSQVTGLGPSAAAYSWELNATPFMSLNIPFNPGGTQVDYSGNNYDATTTGAAYSIEAEGNCQVGGCHFFDGVNDEDDVNQPLSSLMSDTSGSVSLWVRPTGVAPNVSFAYNGDQVISSSFYIGLSQANIGGQDRLWAFNFDTDEDRIGATYTPDAWTHLVWVHDGGQLSFYKDGSLVGTVPSGNTQSTNQEVRIGNTVAFGQPFQGYIDEVQVYPFGLSLDQITILYNNGSTNIAGPIDIADDHVNLNDTWNLSVTPFESDGTPFAPNNSGNTTTGFINTPPNVPVLVSPADGASVVSLSPTVTARYTDINAGQFGTIDFRISSGSAADCLNNVNIVNSGSSPTTASIDEDASYTVGVVLTNNTTYNWCARSDDTFDQSNSGNFTTMGAFTIDLGNAPNFPTLIAPENASTTNLLQPILEVNYSDSDPGDIGTSEFRVSSGSAADCLSNTSIVWSGSSSATITNNETASATVGIALTNLTTYNWCARNNDGVFTSDSGNYTTMGSFLVDTSFSPGGGLGTILNQQGGGGNNDPSSDPQVEQQPAEIENFDVSLSFVDINNNSNSARLESGRILFGTISLQNINASTAQSVFLNLPIPNYLVYVPGSLQIDGAVQSDSADEDPGQANQNAVSAIWSSLAPNDSKFITFQLLSEFDPAEGLQPSVIETISLQASVSVANAAQDFFSNTVQYELEFDDPISSDPAPSPSDPETPSSPTDSSPSIPPSDDASQDDSGSDDSSSNDSDNESSDDTQDNQSDDSSESNETQDDANESTDAPDSSDQSDAIDGGEDSTSIDDSSLQSRSPQEQTSVNESTPSSPIIPLVAPEQDDNQSDSDQDNTSGDTEDELFITGNIQSQSNQIEFSGTVNEPNTEIIVVINNESFTVQSDENGLWEAFVSAEELGVQENTAQQFEIEAFAVSPETGEESNRIQQQIFVERQGDELIAEPIIETVSSNAVVQFIDIIPEQLAEFVEEQEEEIQTTLAVTAPLVAVSSISIWGYLPFLPTMLFHFLSWFISLFRKKKEGRLYGIAYNSITKQPIPLAIVRIYKELQDEAGVADEHRQVLVSTVVTDKQGRYEALLEPGSYTIDVRKPQYTFPSKLVSGEVDGEYMQLYNATKGLEVTTSLLSLPDIALDPEHAKRVFRVANMVKKLWLSIQKVGNHLAVPVLFLGVLTSALVIIHSPQTIVNWILALIYVLLLVLQLVFREHPEKAWGVVYDITTNAVLPLTTLQLIDPEFAKVIKSRLSDYEGRFAFLPEPGTYLIKATKEGYMQSDMPDQPKGREPIQDTITVEKEGQQLSGDIAMKQQ